MNELIYSVSVLTEQGTYEFLTASDKPQDEFADEITAAFTGGVVQFETVDGASVTLNRERCVGLIVQPAKLGAEE